MSDEETCKTKELAKDILRLVTEMQVENPNLNREDAYRAIALALACRDNYEANARMLSVANELSKIVTAIYNKDKV